MHYWMIRIFLPETPPAKKLLFVSNLSTLIDDCWFIFYHLGRRSGQQPTTSTLLPTTSSRGDSLESVDFVERFFSGVFVIQQRGDKTTYKVKSSLRSRHTARKECCYFILLFMFAIPKRLPSTTTLTTNHRLLALFKFMNIKFKHTLLFSLGFFFTTFSLFPVVCTTTTDEVGFRPFTKQPPSFSPFTTWAQKTRSYDNIRLAKIRTTERQLERTSK